MATRPAKPDEAAHPAATLRAGWRTRAEHLVDVDRMIASALGNVRAPVAIVCPTVDEVLEAVETRHSEWSESQLIEQIAMRTTGPDPATIADMIEHVRAEAMASAGVVDLCPPVEPGDIVRASDGRSVGLAPSAVRYSTSRHLLREVELVEWATVPAMARHQRHGPAPDVMAGLDQGQADAVTAILGTTRPVTTVVGPAGAGKTRTLAAAVDSWRHAGVHVFGVGPSASSAQQLADGAGTAADTLHKLVYEHHTKWVERRQPPDREWAVPAGSVVIIDEAGMVDTRLLHTYAQIAQRKEVHARRPHVYEHLTARRRAVFSSRSPEQGGDQQVCVVDMSSTRFTSGGVELERAAMTGNGLAVRRRHTPDNASTTHQHLRRLRRGHPKSDERYVPLCAVRESDRQR